ncbi:UNVERIFIED_CONTAM: hypothetical protein GTU68_015578 [Idotea baltica]|uniref:CDP-alcohol phosphatidyltransferase family protein n=1 Tax=unclassified Aliivibrio TaxID=2645654 RepID=UPI00080DF548|nr:MULTISPECIES: CDP-alcohol phosphatidyltransferase family protein [unclassified Aliivibrio]MCL4117510.1 hypothetical protein [Idotea baltica]OCH17457.1 hypothetical protein A6E05_14345 [Aliivibrio sp. 1S165]OCH23485.1 hypothetical protein A6E03_07450 [Aliivibrio sp. 1S128]OCH34450.1 hypothetical protein A6E06_01085 [Aliivibrio sp. 1S175]
MSIYQLKPRFQSLLRPCVNRLANADISANQVTLFTLIFTFGASVALFSIGESVWWGVLPIVLFIRMALNAIDGMLAREHNMTSSLGLVLNEVCDLISDAAIYLSFIAITGFNAYALFGFVLLAWLSEVIAILSVQITQNRANQGPLGKSDRAFLFGVLGLLVALGIDFTPIGLWIILIANLAIVVTIYKRLHTII